MDMDWIVVDKQVNSKLVYGREQSLLTGACVCTFIGNGLVFESKDKVRQLACGREHSHIVTTQGLYSFGNGMYGQLGVGKSKATHPGTFVVENKPCQVVTRGTVTDIACGLDHTVFATGNNERQQSHSSLYLFISPPSS